MRRLVLIVPLLLLGACSTPKPILYPNDHLRTVGEAAAEEDIQECEQLAEEAGAGPEGGKTAQVAKSTVAGGAVGAASGAVGGAVVGRPGRGAKIGAAAGATGGLLRGLFRSKSNPSQTYKNWVNQCLKDKGYQPMGWQ
jgi:hypothetical protein